MPSPLRHLQLALRSLRRSPAFTLTVVATLAIGIGLNAAIFTVVDNVLLRPLGYHDADRIVAIQTHFDKENRSIPRVAALDYQDMLAQVHGLTSLAHYYSGPEGLQLDGQSFFVNVAGVSPRFTQVLGVQPLAGRLLNPGDREGTDALLSAALVQQHFASPAAALGKSVLFDGHLYTVVGVLPPGFGFPSETEAWFELPEKPRYGGRTSYNENVVARLAPGVTPQALHAELATFSARLQSTVPDDQRKSFQSISLHERIVGKVRPTLNLLMGAVLVVLLIVCVNLTHLQLVRATRQRRVLTIRTALGASRAAITRAALLDTALLALGGTVLGLLLAWPTLHLLLRVAPANTPRLNEVHLNLDVFFFSAFVALLVMLLAALLPLWRSWHADPAEALRAGSSRATEGRGSVRLRNSFIVAETALTLTLAVAALLLTRQLILQSHQDLGFQADHLVSIQLRTIDPPALDPHETQAQREAREIREVPATLARLDSTLASIAAVPGVTSVAAVAGAPLQGGNSDISFAIEGQQTFSTSARMPDADIRPITPNYFATLGIPLLRGRIFTPEDRFDSPRVVLINQALARTHFAGIDPIGHRVAVGYDTNVPAFWTIIGIVADTRNVSPALAPEPSFYAPIAQHPYVAGELQLMVRTPATPAVLIPTLQATLERTHPESATRFRTMADVATSVQRTEHFRTTLFTLFAAVSILLAAVGMYGVTAYTVAQRRFEFALRVALGATRTQLLTRVLSSAFAVALIGVGAGTLLSLSLQRILGSIVGKLPAFDAVAYSLAAFAILLIALAATLIPARRAAHVDPNTVLRSE